VGDASSLLDLVRAAGPRVAPARLGELAARVAGRWQEAENTISREFRRSPRAAEALLRAFARVAGADGSREAVGRAARLHGSWLAYRGKYRSGIAAYEEAEGLLRGAARDGARLGRAGCLLRLGHFDEAIRACRAARRAATRRGDGLLAAGADMNHATALHESGRALAAVPLYARAEQAFATAGRDHLAAVVAQNRANALVLLDRFVEAEHVLSGVIAHHDRAGLDHEAANARLNQGALLSAQDRLGDADSILAAAEEELAAAGDPVRAAACRLERGETLLRARLLPEAVHAIETARRDMRRGAPPAERRRATLLLAETEIAQGDGARGLHTLRALAPQTPAERAWKAELAGRAHAAEGRPGRARRLLLEAAEGFGRDRPAGRGRALLAAAGCALREDDLAGARALTARAARAVDSVGTPSLQFGLAALRFLIAARSGPRARAAGHLQRALESLERVRAGLGRDALRSALLTGREEFVARAFRFVLDAPGGEAAALELLERLRARALVDLLGDAGRIVGVDGDRLAALRAEVAALERRMEGRPGPGWLRGGEAGADPKLVSRLRAAERRLADAVDRAAKTRSRPHATIEQLRAGLPRGALVLCYYADEVGTCVFAVTRDEVWLAESAVSVGTLARLERDLRFRLAQFTVGREFAERHATRLRRETDEILEQVSSVLLEPVAEAVRRASSIVVVPHGPLHRLPLGALPFDGRPLIAHAPVRLAPALAALGRPARRARGRPVVLGFHDELTPAIEGEVRSVARALPGARLRVGDDARLDSLAAMPRPSCLHLAGHGRYRPDAPAMSGIRLADGWLRAADFRTLDLTGSTVVLSGCETGVSHVGAGDEVHGLVRGVLAAGARELVASLWRVDDPATAKLMESFHTRRRAGRSAVEALAKAQLEQARAGVHPWYWAGFQVWSR